MQTHASAGIALSATPIARGLCGPVAIRVRRSSSSRLSGGPFDGWATAGALPPGLELDRVGDDAIPLAPSVDQPSRTTGSHFEKWNLPSDHEAAVDVGIASS